MNILILKGTRHGLLLAVCLLLLSQSPLFAQPNYQPGYVVTMAADTLHGYVDHREWNTTPSSFNFKEQLTADEVLEFDVRMVQYFEITGKEAYQRYVGPVTRNPIDLNHYAYQSTVPIDQATVFLQVLVKGKHVNLLSYTDDLKTRYFIQENDGTRPQELFYKKEFAPGSKSDVVIQKGYVGQLKHLAMKYEVITPRLQNKIEAAHYAAYDLEKLIFSMNGSDEITKAYVSGSVTNTRFYSGIALNSSKLVVFGFAALKDADQNPPSFMPKLAVGYDIFLNKHIQRFFLRVELAASAANYQIINKYKSYRDYYNIYTYTVNQQTASFNPQLMYTIYNREQFKYYLGAGVNLNLSNYSQNSHQIEYFYADGSPRSETSVNLIELPLMGYWFSFGLRTGAIINKKYEITGIYSPQVPVSRSSPHKIMHTSLSVGVNYMFNQ